MDMESMLIVARGGMCKAVNEEVRELRSTNR